MQYYRCIIPRVVGAAYVVGGADNGLRFIVVRTCRIVRTKNTYAKS